ncbi:hypothetical protein B0H19DRAFT_1255241 [Mycena capillaripes]|nr:hypothetical protein B0H19DRAFT_1255241 [Mycena capillaripes]
MGSSYFTNSSLATATHAQIPNTLRAITLRCAIDEQPNWFLADLGSPRAPPLTTLRIREAGARDFSVIVRALDQQGGSLESFALDFSNIIVEVAFLRNHFLEANTVLRRLELTLGSAAMIELCVVCLSHMASPVLEDLVLDFWVDPARFALHPWEALDTIIANGPVRSVQLRVGALISWAPLASNIRRRMPICDALGVLWSPDPYPELIANFSRGRDSWDEDRSRWVKVHALSSISLFALQPLEPSNG